MQPVKVALRRSSWEFNRQGLAITIVIHDISVCKLNYGSFVAVPEIQSHCPSCTARDRTRKLDLGPRAHHREPQHSSSASASDIKASTLQSPRLPKYPLYGHRAHPPQTRAKMSASAQGSTDTKKAVVSDSKNGEPAVEQKANVPLEEDDEFEDFPLEGESIGYINFA